MRPLLLDRVLRGQDEKRARQLIGVSTGGHVLFLHRFQQRRLSLRGCTIDFICKQHIGENRALHELKGVSSRGGIFLKNVCTGNVRGHQIGRELDTMEGQFHDLGDGAD